MLIVEDDPYRDLYFPDVTREDETRPIAAIDAQRRRHLPQQLLEDAGAGIPRRLVERAAPLCGQARAGQAGRRSVHRRPRSARRVRGVPARPARQTLAGAARVLPAKRDAMSRALERTLREAQLGAAARRVLPLGASSADDLTSDRLLSVARQRGVIFVTGAAFFVDGTGDRFLRLCFSCAVAGADRGRRQAARGRRRRGVPRLRPTSTFPRPDLYRFIFADRAHGFGRVPPRAPASVMPSSPTTRVTTIVPSGPTA